MAKSISASLKLLLQKQGDKLIGKRPTREEVVKDVAAISKESRKGANRSWGDTKRGK